jgi:hypothetical protein
MECWGEVEGGGPCSGSVCAYNDSFQYCSVLLMGRKYYTHSKRVVVCADTRPLRDSPEQGVWLARLLYNEFAVALVREGVARPWYGL